MKVYIFPDINTAMSSIGTNEGIMVTGNSLTLINELLKELTKTQFNELMMEQYRTNPDLFWNIDEVITEEEGNELPESFIGLTPREICETATGVLY